MPMPFCKKIYAFFFFIILLCSSDVFTLTVYAAEAPPPERLYAKYALLMDADNGRVLFEKNGYERAPMASTTKIMTLIVALECGNLDDVVTISKYASTMPDTQLNIKAGEQYILKDLLYSLMLESHNDSAVAIAEHIGGSEEEFAKLMNEKAKDLGAYETNFVTVNGLDKPEHYTTAYDLALIARYAIQNEDFIAITNTRNYSFNEQQNGRHISLVNKNRFLDSYNGAIGMKTGFTGEAGYCFAGAAKRDGKTFISIVFACGWPPHKTYKWKDTNALMDYGMKNYEMMNVIEKDLLLSPVSVEKGINEDETDVYIKEGVSLLLSETDMVNVVHEIPKSMLAPIEKDSIIGSVDIYINDILYQKVNVYAGKDIEKVSFIYYYKLYILKYGMIEGTI